VRALLDDAAVVEHDEPVGVAERAEAVRDRDRRPAPDEPGQGVLDLGLGLGVDRARRLVEDQDARVLEEGPRDRDPLPLAARELGPPLADDRAVSVVQGTRSGVPAGDVFASWP